MNVSEEEVEQRLRALFADERLDLPPPADATRTIVAGARRVRRRRRAVAVTSGVAAAALVVAGGLVGFKVHSQSDTAALTPGSELNVQTSQPPTPPATTATPAPATSTLADSVPADSSRKEVPQSTPRTSTKPPVKPVTSGPLLTADGFGSLKLGMTESDVSAQGVALKSAKQWSAACTSYDAQGGGLPALAAISFSESSGGLMIVSPMSAAHTPERVGVGSTMDDVYAAYSGATPGSDGIVAPAGGIGEYHFKLNDAGNVSAVALYNTNQDCVSG